MKFIGKKEGVEVIVHFSEIFSKLMKESERMCKCHASDLFISWEGVLEEMRSPDFFDTFPKTFLWFPRMRRGWRRVLTSPAY